MDKKLVKKILFKIFKTEDYSFERIKHEEDEEFYNVYLVEKGKYKYIFKKSSESEINVYKNISSECFPKLIQYIKYYNKLYILIEYIEGKNLMIANKEEMLRVIDSLIAIQNRYWNSNIVLTKNYESKLESVLNRRKYLFNQKLEKAYDRFVEVFKKINKTFCHDDLLPFNVILNDKKAYLIDLEYAGILPFPLSICRFLTHYKEEESYLFYLKEEDKEFGYRYYYDKFIKYKGISYAEYQYIVNCFIFYEFTEWVYVYNKYNSKKDDRFEYYYKNAIKYANVICE